MRSAVICNPRIYPVSVSFLRDVIDVQENDYDTVTVTASKVLLRPDGRAAILLTGHRRPTEPYSVAFEVNLQNLAVLRAEIAKAEQFLLALPGRA